MSESNTVDVPREIFEMAEEIVGASDVIGIETWRLELLLGRVLYHDRSTRRDAEIKDAVAAGLSLGFEQLNRTLSDRVRSEVISMARSGRYGPIGLVASERRAG